ncbi:odorant receptor 9a-like [Bacillus rossius redtenbacheri]|uniref:odorant receptor 9a-like n=1 Tax=Bacillus rossius redtenbacheri TaxID=93214 RepID=UPI002FDE070A
MTVVEAVADQVKCPGRQVMKEYRKTLRMAWSTVEAGGEANTDPTTLAVSIPLPTREHGTTLTDGETRKGEAHLVHQHDALAPVQAESRQGCHHALQHLVHARVHAVDQLLAGLHLCACANSVGSRHLQERAQAVGGSTKTQCQNGSHCHWNVQTLADLLSPLMFQHYMMSSANLCLVGYEIAMAEDVSQIVALVIHLAVLLGRIFLLSHFSSEIMYQSTKVSQMAYFCNWFHFSGDCKRTLVLIMSRAQKPIVMKTGWFGILSLETFAGLVQAAYSYYTLLKKLTTP